MKNTALDFPGILGAVVFTQGCNFTCPYCHNPHLVRFFGLPVSETEVWEFLRKRRGLLDGLVISGGEPTLHPDLPELVRAARALFPAVQLNSNGLLLAERPGLAEALAKAGLSWVFLQFDGTKDAIFTALRGRPLLRQKLAAIEACKRAGLAVVLVPTVAAGINEHNLGDLLRLAISHSPTVRGLHLQPMTGSGRNRLANEAEPLTLPEVLQAICAQSKGLMRPEHAAPPGCEHERCSFHCRYRLTSSGALLPLRGESPCCGMPDAGPDTAPPAQSSSRQALPLGRTEQPLNQPLHQEDSAFAGMRRAVDTILRVWQPAQQGEASGPGDAFDAFIRKARGEMFSITCMAFQDARSVDLERLKGCCVHVYAPPARLIPFCAYNLTSLDGRPLHRPLQRENEACGKKRL